MVALALAALALAAADPTAGLSNRQLAGQRIVVGFSGTSAPAPLLRRIHRGELGGVILFSDSISSRGQVRRLTASLQKARPAGAPPLIVSIDQEGGQVKRLSGAPTLSPPELGARNDPALARRQGAATAANLRGVGVNVNLAPVLDVARPGSIMRRQQRSYSGSPGRVARIGGAFVRGMTAGHVAATGKHFPGLGTATKNQDLEVNRLNTPLAELRSTDELPFKALSSDLSLVMVSSAIYPALSGRPAVFSKRVVAGELRGHAGFRGVTISDALDAPAMARYGSVGRRAALAAEAGVD
ncbi:MAG: beta-N-acetylhexosaminidase, partial [Thermoleophilaceae bacterium]|nr:beta-N-acetylhexosaminidase [Thermoleophilaceae bacterium]